MWVLVFALARLWMSFAVGRYAYSFADDKETVDDDLNVYFAPDKLLPGGNPPSSCLGHLEKKFVPPSKENG